MVNDVIYFWFFK